MYEKQMLRVGFMTDFHAKPSGSISTVNVKKQQT